MNYKQFLKTKVGSTPLARGTRAVVENIRRKERFNPARAGNSLADLMFAVLVSVQPRSRGEL